MIFVHDLRASGVVRNTLAIARRVAEDHDVLLVARYRDGLLAEDAQSRPFVFRALFAGGRSASTVAATLRLRSVVREWRPDVLLSTGNRGHAVARLALLGRRRPLLQLRISNSMDSGRRDFGLRRAFAKWLSAGADTVFLVGQATGQSAAFAKALAGGRARAVPSGIDRERASKLAAEDAPEGYPGGDLPMVLSVGRLAPQKDFPTLVRAATIASRTQPFRLVIVGKGDAAAMAELRRVAASYGLDEDRFRLVGETDNVFAWLARAAVFVLPSRWEGSSLALLEALAADVPVVATRQAGDAVQVLGEGRYGILVDAGDAAAMASAILRQLSPERVPPNDRAAQFDIRETLNSYAEGVNAAVERASVVAGNAR